MKYLNLYTGIYFSFLLALSACGETPQPLPQSSNTSASSAASSVSSTQAASSSQASTNDTVTVWPPPDPDGKAIVPAENMLADNYYVVLDGSGSMGDADCADGSTKEFVANEALETWASSVPKHANLGLMAFFGGTTKEWVPLGTENRDYFAEQVKEVGSSSGTPLHNAVLFGYRALETQARRQNGYGKYHLVIVTDGVASPANQDPTRIVNFVIENSPIIIHTIGFCLDTTHSLNQKGRTVYKAAGNPEELKRGLESVLGEAPSFDVSAFTS